MKIYEPITTIKETPTKTITIVRNQIDGLFYVKRVLKAFDESVYRCLQQLDSKFFPKIEYLENKDDQLIVIEEYINCATLDVYMANHKMTEAESRSILYQLCDALTLLHTHQIIFRDIKPENIFYDRGRVILFDFDISRMYVPGQDKDTQMLGSVGYASPEQYGFGQSDARSDIFSMGMLMKELLPQEKKVIEKAIHVDPEKRYQSAQALKYAIMHRSNLHGIVFPGYNNPTLVSKIASFGYVFFMAACFLLPRQGEPYIWYRNFEYFLIMYALIFCFQNNHLVPLENKRQRILVSGMAFFFFFFLLVLIEMYAVGIPNS